MKLIWNLQSFLVLFTVHVFPAPSKKQICKAVSWPFTILYITRTETRLTALSLSKGLNNRRASIGREKLRAYS